MTTTERIPAITALDPSERDLLRSIADSLIPAAHGMPSAGAVVTDARLAFVLGSRPDLVEPLRAALRPALGDAVTRRLHDLAESEPATLAALQLVIVAAYYTDDDVRGRLDYPGQLALAIDVAETPAYVSEGLIEQLEARGPVWRDPATGQRARGTAQGGSDGRDRA